MIILMPTEFFHPFARGGSEWSVYHLSQSLIKLGHKVIILTPNYGTKSTETWQGLKIIRFNIGKKLANYDDPVTPFWHTNPWWLFRSTLALIQSAHHYHADIIHVQGKYFLPTALITKIITRIPVIATIRDYQILCNLGLCLWTKSRRCTPLEFLTQELPKYHKKYNPAHSILSTILGRLVSIYLRLCTRFIDQIVCISRSQQKIFAANGFKNTQVIYNTTRFIPTSHKPQATSYLLFVGRPTPGKGAHLLQPIFKKIQVQFPHFKLRVVSGGTTHKQVEKYYQKASVVVVPSLWPEPFGRVALEAIASGTPVVTSNRGGLPEIVQNRYGLSVAPTVNQLAAAAVHVLKHRSKYIRRIRQDRVKLRHQFELLPVQQYLSLYASCLSPRR